MAKTKARQCPDCRASALDTTFEYDVEVDLCRLCGGIWFDAGELARVIRVHDAAAMPAEQVVDCLGPRLRDRGGSCPGCTGLLSVFELSSNNAVAIDVCGRCSGVWVPGGRLAEVQAGHQLVAAERLLERALEVGDWVGQFLTGLPRELNLPPRNRPWVTYSLIAIQCLLFLAELTNAARTGDGLLGGVFSSWMLYPDRLGQPVWLATLFTSMFLHGGWIHLLGNMYFLWILGDNVEDVLGRWRYLAFYLAAGVSGGVFFSFFSTLETPAIGASGAISGLLGAYVVLFPRARLTFMLIFFQGKLVTTYWLLLWIAYNLAGLWLHQAGIAWEAHLGGLLFGYVAIRLVRQRLLQHRPLVRLVHRIGS